MFTFKGKEEEGEIALFKGEEEGEIAFRKKLCFIGRLFKLFDETSRFVAVLSLSSLLWRPTQLYLTVWMYYSIFILKNERTECDPSQFGKKKKFLNLFLFFLLIFC